MYLPSRQQLSRIRTHAHYAAQVEPAVRSSRVAALFRRQRSSTKSSPVAPGPARSIFFSPTASKQGEQRNYIFGSNSSNNNKTPPSFSHPNPQTRLPLTPPTNTNANLGSSKETDHPPSSSSSSSSSFSLQDLGMTRSTRLVVLIFVGILGTVESVFWAQTGWRWYQHRFGSSLSASSSPSSVSSADATAALRGIAEED